MAASCPGVRSSVGALPQRSKSRITTPVAAGIVAGLTALAFYLRLRAASESLAGDEIFLYSIVHGRSLGRTLELIHDTESTPPLHFLLAWASDRLGASPEWIRLPSVLFSTATVPLVYLLGAKVAGRSAGLLAAALLTLAPFAVFYGSEGRAYAMLAFLVTASTLALLEAVSARRAQWWVAFTLLSLGVLYTHYTGIFVVAAQLAWAFFGARGNRRATALSTAAMVLLYLPWIPSFLVQRKDNAEQRIESFDASVADGLIRVFPGHPLVAGSRLPGSAWLLLLGAALAVTLAALARHASSRRGARSQSAGSSLVLVGVVAAAAPLGAWLYTLGPTSIFIPRNLISSLPRSAWYSAPH